MPTARPALVRPRPPSWGNVENGARVTDKTFWVLAGGVRVRLGGGALSAVLGAMASAASISPRLRLPPAPRRPTEGGAFFSAAVFAAVFSLPRPSGPCVRLLPYMATTREGFATRDLFAVSVLRARRWLLPCKVDFGTLKTLLKTEPHQDVKKNIYLRRGESWRVASSQMKNVEQISQISLSQ